LSFRKEEPRARKSGRRKLNVFATLGEREISLRVAPRCRQMMKVGIFLSNDERCRSCDSLRAGGFGAESDCANDGEHDEKREHNQLRDCEWQLGLRSERSLLKLGLFEKPLQYRQGHWDKEQSDFLPVRFYYRRPQ
jgi:hypothetical protein